MSDSEDSTVPEQALPVSIEKPKKKRTPSAKQLESLSRARDVRKEKARVRREALQALDDAPEQEPEPQLPVHVQQPVARRKKKPVRRTYVQQAYAEEPSSSESEEEEIVYVAPPRRKPKKSKKKTRVVVQQAPQYESDTSQSSEGEQPQQKAVAAPAQPNFYFA